MKLRQPLTTVQADRYYLESTLPRMITTPTKQTRRFDAEVANLLFPAIEETVSVWRFQRVLGGLRSLLLRLSHLFLLLLLRLEVLEHRPEVAELELRDLNAVPL